MSKNYTPTLLPNLADRRVSINDADVPMTLSQATIVRNTVLNSTKPKDKVRISVDTVVAADSRGRFRNRAVAVDIWINQRRSPITLTLGAKGAILPE